MDVAVNLGDLQRLQGLLLQKPELKNDRRHGEPSHFGLKRSLRALPNSLNRRPIVDKLYR
jgi:hypothetical protein